ncbi:hypothetical protein BDR26DRAFT_990605 [Obelidium mucronatum]|nr:hypothetical protein BDR26DRAFT_990605 [Obelidium mucronatum]
MSTKIFVGNLSWGTTDESLQQAFSQYGVVTDSIVLKDRETGRSRGFGFVTMESSDEAQAAIDALNEQEIDGRTVRVNVANDRPAGDRPPRGDFGGNRGGYRGGRGGYGGNSGGYGGNSGGYGNQQSGGYQSNNQNNDGLLRSLDYNITYPVAPSFFLVQLMRYKNATTDSILRSKCLCQNSPKHDCQCASNILKKESEAFDEAAAVLFYLRLLLQNICDQTHLLTTGPFTHLVLWILHCFTLTVVLASTVSFAIYPPDVASEERGLVTVIVGWGMCMELFFSAWRVHGKLVFATALWSVTIAAGVITYKTIVQRDSGASTQDAFDSALLGLEFITGSFAAVWVFGLVRDYLFPAVCKVTECSCKQVELLQGFTYAYVEPRKDLEK